MKNAVLYLNILFCATFMLACEQDVEVFHASGEDRLIFTMKRMLRQIV